MTKTVNSVANKSTLKSEEKISTGRRKSDSANHVQCWNCQIIGHSRCDCPTLHPDRPKSAVCYWFGDKHYKSCTKVTANMSESVLCTNTEQLLLYYNRHFELIEQDNEDNYFILAKNWTEINRRLS